MVLRVGLVGAGGITRSHVSGWATVADRAEIVAIADVSEEAARARMKQIGREVKYYKDYRDMLAASDIDAVDMALPHFLHCESIVAAAEAGKHAMSEKPFCLSLEEAEKIRAAVDKAGTIFMAAHNQLFFPTVQRAKQMIMLGDLGKIYQIDSLDCSARRGPLSTNKSTWFGDARRQHDTWRNDPAKMGGGELIDTGYHPTYRMLFLAGKKPVEVSALLGTYRLPLKLEDTANALIKFEDGMTGRLMSSWGLPGPGVPDMLFAVMAEAGMLWGTSSTLYYQPVGFQEPATVEFPGWDYDRTFAAEIAHFCDAIAGGFEPLHSVKEATDTLKIILGAYESVEKKAIVTL
ncbi:MAG: Gfo/Idh/MocA family protein [Anaerolineae bacterium]|jgi:predicted dehydrogenase|nr:Gfo/Idh/MocA family oxidoreductase [Chloroflexota bacterium]